jgi:hypothetical protein
MPTRRMRCSGTAHCVPWESFAQQRRLVDTSAALIVVPHIEEHVPWESFAQQSTDHQGISNIRGTPSWTLWNDTVM